MEKAAVLIDKCDRALRLAEKAGITIAGIFLFAIMLVVVTDVVMRYFFNAPLSWSYELISLYLMVGLFFFTLSDALAHHTHVAVDILHHYLPDRMRHGAELIGYVLATPVFAAICYLSAVTTWESYQGGDVLAGHIPWPTWLAQICVPLGVGVLALRMALRAFGHTVSFATGRPLIELPPVSGTEERV